MALPGTVPVPAYLNPVEVGKPGHTQLSEWFGGTGYSPEAQFAQFGSRLDPALGRRMSQLQSPLMSRWLLRAPTMMTAGAGAPGSFTDYLTALGTSGTPAVDGAPAIPPAFMPMNYADMRDRAQTAAATAQWAPSRVADLWGRGYDAENNLLIDPATGSPYLSGAQTGDPNVPVGPEELAQKSYYQWQFGSSPQAGQNQRALAQALWQSKYSPAGFGGRIGGNIDPTLSRAMGNTISALYNRRLDQGKTGAGFLDWFLKRPLTAPTETTTT